MSVNKFEAQLLAATKRREAWNQSKEAPSLADSREYITHSSCFVVCLWLG